MFQVVVVELFLLVELLFGVVRQAQFLLDGLYVMDQTELPTYKTNLLLVLVVVTTWGQQVVVRKQWLLRTRMIFPDGAHGHGVNDPGHLHSYTNWSNTASKGGDATNRSAPINSAAANTAGNYTGISIVSGGGHNHNGGVQAPSGATAASNTANLPPYYALAYIMRTS